VVFDIRPSSRCVRPRRTSPCAHADAQDVELVRLLGTASQDVEDGLLERGEALGHAARSPRSSFPLRARRAGRRSRERRAVPQPRRARRARSRVPGKRLRAERWLVLGDAPRHERVHVSPAAVSGKLQPESDDDLRRGRHDLRATDMRAPRARSTPEDVLGGRAGRPWQLATCHAVGGRAEQRARSAPRC